MTTATPGLGTSLVRTLVPIVVGPLVARYFPGVDIKDPETLLTMSAVISYLYYVVVRILEVKAPQVGYLLGIAKAPAYSPASSPSPAAGEDVVAVVVPEGGAAAPVEVEDDVAAVEQTDNRERPEDGEQDVPQDPNVAVE